MPLLDLGLGLGTSGLDDPTTCTETVVAALEAGYRHVDTAQMYDNEAAVGDGIAAADVDRERFRALLKATLRTLAAKGVTLRRKETAAYALQAFDDGKGPDAALAEAIDAGIVAAAASDGQGSNRELRADGGDRASRS